MKRTILIAFLIFCGGGILAMAQGPPQTWTWTVAVDDAENLVGDGAVYETAYSPEGDYSVNVKVLKQTKNRYLFRLHIWKDSDRHISMPGVKLSSGDVYLNPAFGPGYLPEVETTSCTTPEPNFCSGGTDCIGRLQTFLARLHPVCDYASVRLEITVPLDIEGLKVGTTLQVNGGVRLYIENSNASFEQPGDAFHNVDAVNLQTSPLNIQRTGDNTWKLWVDSTGPYLEYGEFYFGYWRKRSGDNKISMLADGPFVFDTTWTRSR